MLQIRDIFAGETSVLLAGDGAPARLFLERTKIVCSRIKRSGTEFYLCAPIKISNSFGENDRLNFHEDDEFNKTIPRLRTSQDVQLRFKIMEDIIRNVKP